MYVLVKWNIFPSIIITFLDNYFICLFCLFLKISHTLIIYISRHLIIIVMHEGLYCFWKMLKCWNPTQTMLQHCIKVSILSMKEAHLHVEIICKVVVFFPSCMFEWKQLSVLNWEETLGELFVQNGSCKIIEHCGSRWRMLTYVHCFH